MQAGCRVENATPATGYLLVGKALYLIHELPLTAVGIHQMGVTVTERGQHGTAVSRDLGGKTAEHCAGRFALPEIREAAVLHKEPGIMKHLQALHLGALQAVLAVVIYH
jgi:hypothetical protein